MKQAIQRIYIQRYICHQNWKRFLINNASIVHRSANREYLHRSSYWFSSLSTATPCIEIRAARGSRRESEITDVARYFACSMQGILMLAQIFAWATSTDRDDSAASYWSCSWGLVLSGPWFISAWTLKWFAAMPMTWSLSESTRAYAQRSCCNRLLETDSEQAVSCLGSLRIIAANPIPTSKFRLTTEVGSM